MRNRALTFWLLLLIVSTDVLDSVAELFMKKGLNHIGISHVGLDNAFAFMSSVAFIPLVWCGIACYLASLFIWMFILSRLDLSIAFPVSSACYIFVPLLAIFFLKEDVGPARWLGIFLIVAGINFISYSKGREDNV